jgi:hypothetical protein
MIDNDLVGMSWITLKKACYFLRPKGAKKCTTQIEVDVVNF